MKKRFGFTLAEVLITLGIIGVVAAMTIPTLLQNINGVRFSAQFKKSLSTLNNAVETSVAHFNTDITSLTAACGGNPGSVQLDPEGDNPENSICGLINSTLSNVRYLGNAAAAYNGATANVDYGTTGHNNGALVYALPDGSWVAVPENLTNVAGVECVINVGEDPAELTDNCHGWIDVNGILPPNRAARCNGADSAPNVSNGACNVRSNGDIGDIYPIVFHNGVVSPSSIAASTILSRSK